MSNGDNDAVYRGMLEAMRHLPVEYTDEDTNQLVAELPCPRCGGKGGVYYTGSIVLEGDIEYYHLMHTEVEHKMRCTTCGANWRIFKML